VVQAERVYLMLLLEPLIILLAVVVVGYLQITQ
jgi:hypothetical protein